MERVSFVHCLLALSSDINSLDEPSAQCGFFGLGVVRILLLFPHLRGFVSHTICMRVARLTFGTLGVELTSGVESRGVVYKCNANVEVVPRCVRGLKWKHCIDVLSFTLYFDGG
jgi:hypothetical protein